MSERTKQRPGDGEIRHSPGRRDGVAMMWTICAGAARAAAKAAGPKLVRRYRGLRRRRTALLLALDVILGVVALVMAHFLRFGLSFSADQARLLEVSAPLFALVCAIVFPAAGLYSTHWRYVTLIDLMRVPRAVVVASSLHLVVLFLVLRLEDASRLAVVIEVFVLVALLLATRLCFCAGEIWNQMSESAAASGSAKIPVVLVGAGRPAEHFIRALQRHPGATYRPVGLLGGEASDAGLTIRNVPILGPIAEAERLLAALPPEDQPRHVIFTDQLAAFKDADAAALVEFADRRGLAVSRLPRATELRRATPESEDLRPVELSDLLERPQAVFDRAAVAALIRGRRVLVTGAGGSIGGEMTAQLASFGPAELTLIDNCEYNLYRIDHALKESFPRVRRSAYICDIRDAEHVRQLFARHRPELVFHAAALKHVPLVELNPVEGVLTNVIGSRNVAEAALRTGALAMVQVSTDKAVNTTNVMGATKRVAELYCQALDLAGGEGGRAETRFMTVRFGNVLGSSGSLIPLFQRQLAKGGPLTVTDPEMRRFFMTIREAVELTLHAAAAGLARRLGQGEIFVLDMGTPIKIVDIARRMIRLAGLRPDEDVRIELVGRRPGEKLFEELFDEQERRADSEIPGVMRAIPTPAHLGVLREEIVALERAARRGDVETVFARLGTLVRGYEPSPEARGASVQKIGRSAAAEPAALPALSAAVPA